MLINKKGLLILALSGLLLGSAVRLGAQSAAPAVAAVSAAPLNTLSEEEKKAGWKLLFDGKTTAGWRNYRKKEISSGWKVVDGALVRADKGAGDIVTTDMFESFELCLEYCISAEGNSGLIYHVSEDEGAPFFTGPEVQIQDNQKAHDPELSGWLYQLYKPANDPATGKPVDATKPAGQWNQLRILITPEKCEHYMNGVKYCEYVKGSKDWDERVAKSKFNKWAKFGKARTGHIDLQDHGNWVAFRNIKIRPIAARK